MLMMKVGDVGADDVEVGKEDTLHVTASRRLSSRHHLALQSPLLARAPPSLRAFSYPLDLVCSRFSPVPQTSLLLFPYLLDAPTLSETADEPRWQNWPKTGSVPT
jgi:hypothetical protein